MIARVCTQTERLLQAIEAIGPIDAVIAAWAILEAENEHGLARAWAQEVEPIRHRLSNTALDYLCDLVIERVGEYEGVSTGGLSC